MRRYAARHAESWYKYVNEVRGRGLENGSLYLITGWEKARSWGMASFQNVALQNEFQLSFTPTTSGTNTNFLYDWQRGTPARKKRSAPLADGVALNQTTFIHGLTISLGTSIWTRLFGDVEISQLADSQSPKSSNEFVPYTSQRWFSM